MNGADDLENIIDFIIEVNQREIFLNVEWLAQAVPLRIELLKRKRKVWFNSISIFIFKVRFVLLVEILNYLP